MGEERLLNHELTLKTNLYNWGFLQESLDALLWVEVNPMSL